MRIIFLSSHDHHGFEQTIHLFLHCFYVPPSWQVDWLPFVPLFFYSCCVSHNNVEKSMTVLDKRENDVCFFILFGVDECMYENYVQSSWLCLLFIFSNNKTFILILQAFYKNREANTINETAINIFFHSFGISSSTKSPKIYI